MEWARRRAAFAGTRTLLAFAALIGALVFVEGVSSVFIFATEILFYRKEPVSVLAAEYDDEIGWKHIPNHYDPDLYGPGVYFQTNSKGFRNSVEFAADVPAGRTRIVCLGDSFTEGLGVSNDQTWCNLLGAMAPAVETVNMGVGGFGVDQAYLLYRREAKDLDYDVLVVAFILHDIVRMGYERFVGYYKPRLQLRGDELVVVNVPVPRPSFSYRFERWYALNQGIFNGLRSFDLGNRVLRRFSPPDIKLAAAGNSTLAALDQQVKPLSMKVFEELSESANRKGAKAVFVFLPTTIGQLRPGIGPWESSRAEAWRQDLTEAFAERGLVLVDVFSAFRALDDYQLREMFDPRHGHYTPHGNEFVAELLRKHIGHWVELPARSTAVAQAPLSRDGVPCPC